jgi:hypothetical protein
MKKGSVVCILVMLAWTADLYAGPPLVSDRVPTANQGTFEFKFGMFYEREGGTSERQIPFTELVYGITDRQEITFEIAYLSQQGKRGFADAVVGTKYILIKETERAPGIAGSFNVELPTGAESQGLGTGEFEYDLGLRVEKTWGWFLAVSNIGYIIVTDSELGGITQIREDVWFASFAQEFQMTPKTKFLSEIYWESREASGESHRLAANVGFEHKLRDNLKIHAAVGKSLREANSGGPDLRVYIGMKWDFDAP